MNVPPPQPPPQQAPPPANNNMSTTTRNPPTLTKFFPGKLFVMLDAVETLGLGHGASWVSEGRAFAIHNPEVFMAEIAPHFFDKQTHLRSFHRQLSIWGFTRLETGTAGRGVWFHKHFTRGQPELIKHIKRVPVKNPKSAPSRPKHHHPDYTNYQIPDIAQEESAAAAAGTLGCATARSPAANRVPHQPPAIFHPPQPRREVNFPPNTANANTSLRPHQINPTHVPPPPPNHGSIEYLLALNRMRQQMGAPGYDSLLSSMLPGAGMGGGAGARYPNPVGSMNPPPPTLSSLVSGGSTGGSDFSRLLNSTGAASSQLAPAAREPGTKPSPPSNNDLNRMAQQLLASRNDPYRQPPLGSAAGGAGVGSDLSNSKLLEMLIESRRRQEQQDSVPPASSKATTELLEDLRRREQAQQPSMGIELLEDLRRQEQAKMDSSRREELAKQALAKQTPAPSATSNSGASELLEDLQRKVKSRRPEGQAKQAAPAPSSGQAPASSSSGASELLEDVRRCQEARRKETEASFASKSPSKSADRERELLSLLQASNPPTSGGTSELLEDLRRRQEEALRKEKASPASNNNSGSAERDRELLTALVRQDLQNTLLQRELQRRQVEQQGRGDSEKPGMKWP